jgi:DNA-binding NarL/FixJ family response regulator
MAAFPWMVAGASACMHRDASYTNILTAIRAVLEENVPGPSAPEGVLVLRGNTPANGRNDTDPTLSLTPREREVIELIDRGLSNKQIAHELTVAMSTVKNHVHNVLRKTHAPDRKGAATLATLLLTTGPRSIGKRNPDGGS